MAADLALDLWRRGYDALPSLRRSVCRQGGDPDAIPTRLLGRPALVVRGPEGARFLYDQALVERHEAVPKAVASLLFGGGAVHGLDGEEHRRRKEMFLSLLGADRVAALTAEAGDQLARATDVWRARGHVVLHDELVDVYATAVLHWAGTGCHGRAAHDVGRDLARIVDGFGGAPLAYPRAWAARRNAEAWAREVLTSAHEHRHPVPPGSAVDVLVHGAGSDLPRDVAAVELLNVVRPTVAVAWLGAFAGVALAEHPQWREALAAPGGDAERRAFAQEVRRLAPFVPALAGRLREDATFRGRTVPRGGRVVLDVVGTDRHPDVWASPDVFDPSRFLDREPGPFDLVPQGGGDPAHGHRCPGEGIAVGLLEETLRRLAALDLELEGSSRFTPHRMPTLPRGRVPLRVRV